MTVAASSEASTSPSRGEVANRSSACSGSAPTGDRSATAPSSGAG